MKSTEALRLGLLPLSPLTVEFLQFGFFWLTCAEGFGSSVALKSAAAPCSPFKFASLDWEDRQTDIELFHHLASLLWRIANLMSVERQRLTEAEIGEIGQLLAFSPLFTAMDSKLIVVSRRHQGSTPFVHTINTLRRLSFSPKMDAQERFLTMLAAVLHDTGKAMAVGAADEIDDIRALMWWHSVPPQKKSEQHTDSYRNHQLISAQVFRALRGQLTQGAAGEQNQGFDLACSHATLLELAIELHHFHADLFRIVVVDERTSQMQACAEVVKRSLPAEQREPFLRIFASLCRADLLSVVHRNNEHWLEFEEDVNKILAEILVQSVNAD